MMENLVKMDDLGVPLFQETSRLPRAPLRLRVHHARVADVDEGLCQELHGPWSGEGRWGRIRNSGLLGTNHQQIGDLWGFYSDFIVFYEISWVSNGYLSTERVFSGYLQGIQVMGTDPSDPIQVHPSPVSLNHRKWSHKGGDFRSIISNWMVVDLW